MSASCIIQARMGSTRLPGKVMKKLDKINPVLYYVINQLQNCKFLDKIIVATTDLNEDNQIEDYVKTLKINYFRGDSKDVLDRYYNCAKTFGLSTIIRITADNPLIDPTLVDEIIKKFKMNDFDYISNAHVRSFPYGTETEIFSFNALEIAWKNAKTTHEREHVTPYFYNNPKKFRILDIKNPKNLSQLRWTIDKEEDLQLVRKIVSKIKKRPILMNDIIKLFEDGTLSEKTNQI